MIYMIHPNHGATHVERGQVSMLEKQGWQEAKAPTAEDIAVLKTGVRAAQLRAELATIEQAEQPAKRKYVRKAE